MLYHSDCRSVFLLNLRTRIYTKQSQPSPLTLTTRRRQIIPLTGCITIPNRGHVRQTIGCDHHETSNSQPQPMDINTHYHTIRIRSHGSWQTSRMCEAAPLLCAPIAGILFSWFALATFPPPADNAVSTDDAIIANFSSLHPASGDVLLLCRLCQ